MSIRAGRLIGPSIFLFFISLLVASTQAQLAGQSASARQVATPSLVVQPLDETKLAVLKGNTHPLARLQYDQGAAPLDLPMNRMLLVLKRSDAQETALRKLLDDQQDKSSPNFHKWLTPEDFGKQFGPSDQDIQTVTTWLQSHGLQIAQIAKGRNIIEFSGTAAQVQEALHTEIHKYVVNGEEHWANAKDPAIPAALTPLVSGVLTLHNFIKKPQIHMSREPIAATFHPGSSPQITFPGTPPVHALGPQDYATIYNINPEYQAGITGTEKTIAVVARSNVYQGGSDVSYFQCSLFSLCSGFNTLYNGPDPGDLGGGEEGEATLDLTWSGSIAPGATIDFVLSASTNTTDGVDLSELFIIDNNLADVMTESFSTCELGATQTQAVGTLSLAEQAAAQGITYIVSTGDSGAEGCDNPSETDAQFPVSVNLLASTPYTVAVGGTMFNENGQDSKYWSSDTLAKETALSYIAENVWNESCTPAQCGSAAGLWSGGGGASIIFAKPSWQSGVMGIPNDGFRDLPDVSLTAAIHDPYLLCLEGSCQQGFIYFVGGTSAAAPSFAGIMALVDQQTNSRQGQADAVLYKLAASESLSHCNGSNTSGLPGNSCIFNDITTGNNAVPGEAGYGANGAQYQAGAGYDLATGLGSVNVANLVNNWNTAAANKPSATTLSFTQTNGIAHGSSVNFMVTVTPVSGSGTPSGDISLIAKTNFGQQSLGFYTLSAGSFSGSTNLLPGGTNNISAHYAGDRTFQPSDSSSTSVTVIPEPSVTTASVLGYPTQNGTFPPFTSGPYGTFVYWRADVHGNSGQGTPTGTVDFFDNIGGFEGPYTLNSQGNTATPNGYFYFVPGAHTFSANYLGDLSFNSSNSTAVPFTITQAPTTIAVTSTGNTQGATLIATVNTAGSGGLPPSGTVSFTLNGQALGSPLSVNGVNAVINSQTDAVTTAASAVANYSDPTLANGQYTVAATYTGDTNYTGSTGSATITVKPDFALTEFSTVIDISPPGGSGSMALSISAEDGFNSAVALSCSGLPSEAKCNFSPASITGTGTSTLTVTSAAPKSAMLERQNDRHQSWWMSATGTIFAGMFLLNGFKKRRWTSLLSLAVFAFLLMLPACGGGSSSNSGGGGGGQSDPGTPAGTSIVTITAIGGSVTHTTTFTLVVQ
ncbi:MAG TPA: protease pro-enzyme activation domain-containing protein [Terriglobales bacterium]|nr:protease pro-enzyme activation domain-containing protein [Terriglobales bacterium]